MIRGRGTAVRHGRGVTAIRGTGTHGDPHGAFRGAGIPTGHGVRRGIGHGAGARLGAGDRHGAGARRGAGIPAGTGVPAGVVRFMPGVLSHLRVRRVLTVLSAQVLWQLTVPVHTHRQVHLRPTVPAISATDVTTRPAVQTA